MAQKSADHTFSARGPLPPDPQPAAIVYPSWHIQIDLLGAAYPAITPTGVTGGGPLSSPLAVWAG